MTLCTIKELNARGEGVGITPDGRPLLIPFTLSGEQVSYSINGGMSKGEALRALPTDILEVSPHRQKAPCPYFTRCGGCLLQHLDSESYVAFKTDLVRKAFDGFPVNIASFERIPQQSRQRINFKALKRNGVVTIGLHRYRSHHMDPIDDCVLLSPRLNGLIVPLRTTLDPLLNDGEEANIFLTEASNGIDMLIDRSLTHVPARDIDSSVSLLAHERLVVCAQNHRIIRITLRHHGSDELIYQTEEPFIRLKEHRLYIPPNPFLQTSVKAAIHMTDIVESLLPNRSQSIVDLFSGLGTFSFSLSDCAPVTAFEGASGAVHFLNYSASKETTIYPIRGNIRDLFKYPLNENELSLFDVVVINPPRAGAVAQVKNLRLSSVNTIIMISCNAHTFARDARILMGGGYKMSDLHLVDQFLWSPHIEVIAKFER